MKAEAINDSTGQTVSGDLSDQQAARLQALDRERMSPGRLTAWINESNLSAGDQTLLRELSKVTVVLQEQCVEVGKRIIDISVALQQQFPHATFGLIVGLVVSILITAIPLLGSVLGGVVTPIAVALGLAIGFSADIRDHALYRKLTDATASFNPLKPSLKTARQALDQLFGVLAPQT